MKNPKSKFVGAFNSVKKRRQTRNLIIMSMAVLLALIFILVLYMSALKKQFDQTFPSGTDASAVISSSGGTTQEEASASTVQSTEPTSEDTTETAVPTTTAPEEGTTETDTTESTGGSDSTSTSETNRNDAPLSITIPEGTSLFPETESVQMVKHNERDIAFSKLKISVKQYIESQSGSRIGVYFINLSSKEEFGYNDLSPFVVGGAFNLPINLMLYDAIEHSLVIPDETITYSSEYDTDAYSLLSGTKIGASYSVRDLSYLSMAQSDAVATSMLLSRIGGIDNLNDKLLEISKIIDFTQVQTYKDYRNIVMEGSRRSSAYDLSNFAEEIYYRYMRNPDTYQNLINDWHHSGSTSVIADTFGASAMTLSKQGINENYDAHAEIALVVAQEPFIMCLMIETPNQTHSDTITRDIAELYKEYLDYCYS
jgi:beta-lactamase class A